MRLTPLVALTLVSASAASAQDVELLGRRYGTRPPDAYYREIERDPGAYGFQRGRSARLREALALRGAAGAGPPGAFGRPGAPPNPVTGTLRLPVVMGLFSDSPAPDAMPYGAADVQASHFGSSARTVSTYYAEVSGGRLTLVGDVYDWVRTRRSREQTAAGVSGLTANTTGPFITEILQGLEGVDWGAYDNDGPDGLPNSGDDDGFVDALAVFHPTLGAECPEPGGGNRIWSHKWNLTEAGPGAFTTGTPAASGGFIRIDDYFVQGILACGGRTLNEIGVFAHETGHAFGLPDLYDTRPRVQGNAGGAGNWDLMASGGWGCDDHSASVPCHMGAWSKHVLGWLDVTVVTPDTDHGTVVLPPVETTGQALLVEASDGSGEYYLLENRQPVGFDSHIYGPGLLIWQIDPDWVEEYWELNWINAFSHLGVWIRQADGSDFLARGGGGRGDFGDPFPLVHPTLGNDEFHAGSNPSARSWSGASNRAGTATGLTLLDIERVGADVRFRLSTRRTRVALGSRGDAGYGGLFKVDGSDLTGTMPTHLAAPFDSILVEAAEGAREGEGVRRLFDGWLDDPEALRARSFVTALTDTTLVALYDERQVQLGVEIRGGQDGVGPGAVVTLPPASDRWFAEGTEVTVKALAEHSFAFTRWTGDLEGRPNPTVVTLDAPLMAGADFELTYRVAVGSLDLAAADVVEVDLGVEEGTFPFLWGVTGGALPKGLTLSTAGQLRGTALEFGTFPVTVVVQDHVGLRVEGQITFEVARPAIPLTQLTQPFLSVGTPPTLSQRLFLDHQGNRDGGYDLGDARAWLLADPDLPLEGSAAREAGPRRVIVKLAPLAGGAR